MHQHINIVDRSKIASGSYTQQKLKKLVERRWKEYAQASLDASILSMPGRLESVVRRKGDYLMKGEDY